MLLSGTLQIVGRIVHLAVRFQLMKEHEILKHNLYLDINPIGVHIDDR